MLYVVNRKKLDKQQESLIRIRIEIVEHIEFGAFTTASCDMLGINKHFFTIKIFN